jgi:hypothetical protein
MRVKLADLKFIVEMNDSDKWIEIRPFSNIYAGLEVVIMVKQYDILKDKTNIIRDKRIVYITYYDYEIESILRQYIRDICNYRIVERTAENIITSLFYDCFIGKITDDCIARNNMNKDFWKDYFPEEYEMTIQLMRSTASYPKG